jgi:membrane-bound serine protease (ClpP class)
MTALGVSLLIVGAIVIAVEAHVPTLGVLGGPGVLALGVGTVLAVGGLGGGIAVALLTALAVVAASVGVLGVSVHKGLAVRRRRVSTGAEGLIGHVGVVRSWAGRTGSVLVDGALWRARRSWSEEEQLEIHAGDTVVVERLDGLTVSVRPAEDWEVL